MSVAGGLQIIQDLPLASEPEVTSLTILKNDTYKNNLVTNPWILLLYIVNKSNRDQSMVCGMVFLLRVFSICDFFCFPLDFAFELKQSFSATNTFRASGRHSSHISYVLGQNDGANNLYLGIVESTHPFESCLIFVPI